MEYLDKVLEKLKDLAQRVIELLLGPDVETEMEPVPIPVRSREYYR
ncbi:MAG: hypothetical protein ACFCU8_07225 [Thermosynechococcaceae cyanobacterium]